MLVDQRRQHILKAVESKGFVSLQELSELCDASESTVRRDLEHLDNCGTIRRTRDGAAVAHAPRRAAVRLRRRALLNFGDD